MKKSKASGPGLSEEGEEARRSDGGTTDQEGSETSLLPENVQRDASVNEEGKRER